MLHIDRSVELGVSVFLHHLGRLHHRALHQVNHESFAGGSSITLQLCVLALHWVVRLQRDERVDLGQLVFLEQVRARILVQFADVWEPGFLLGQLVV